MCNDWDSKPLTYITNSTNGTNGGALGQKLSLISGAALDFLDFSQRVMLSHLFYFVLGEPHILNFQLLGWLAGITSPELIGVTFKFWEEHVALSFPYAPCTIYLPAFGWFLGQMLVNIPYMEHMGLVYSRNQGFIVLRINGRPSRLWIFGSRK